MDLARLFHDLFFDYTLRTVAIGSATLGVVSGSLGSYALLRRQSLVGDAISHAALPGVALAFLLTGSKSPLVLLLGAIIAGWLGTLAVSGITRSSRVSYDSALGLMLAVFFGFGLMLLTFIQRRPNANQAGLDRFLFGQAATLVVSDVLVMLAVGGVALLAMLAFWKELKLLSFDPDYAATLGLPVRRLDMLITTLLVLAIAIGLQTVGVVLMSALVVAPAAGARQWTNRLGVMIGLAALFGALSGVGGAVLSSSVEHLPTGPTVVLLACGIALLSLLIAPGRGMLWTWAVRRRNRRRLQVGQVLENLYRLASQHDDPGHGHSVEVLRAMSFGQGGVRRSLRALEERELVRQVSNGCWGLTSAGVAEARRQVQEVQA